MTGKYFKENENWPTSWHYWQIVAVLLSAVSVEVIQHGN